ncbi:acetyltransferase [Leptolyngbyaceae cyanobacterium JSC-12]|nr:acetyltransferase [Leptolyngbyaceae cyanobacterium JSC-12]
MTAYLSTYRIRLYSGEADLPAIAHLINTCKTADSLDDFASVEELGHRFASPDFDISQDLRLWEDGLGEICAIAQCWLPEATDVQNCFLWFSIRPDMREIGLEIEVLTWAEARVKQVAQQRNVSAQLRSGARNDQVVRLNFLKQQNFVVDRHFYRMARSLTEPIPEPQLPAGFYVRPLQGVTEAAAWVEMFNQTFIDHWNFHPLTVEDRKHWMEDSAYVPELDLVVVAPDGTLAAFCYNLIYVQENDRTGRKEGWIADLGTRRGFRRIGLGRAMLLTGMLALKARGMEIALLGVDSENPSGAFNLYQSVGFRQRYSFISHVKFL